MKRFVTAAALGAALVVSQHLEAMVRADAQLGSTADAGPLLQARKVALIGETGKRMMDRGWANPNGERGRQKLVDVLTKWGRYEIVENPTDADLVLVLTEFQKNINIMKRANLVAELKVYRGGEVPTEQTPVLWSGDASESFRRMPATGVGEKFRDHVMKLEKP
jgi:hypothetical protein